MAKTNNLTPKVWKTMEVTIDTPEGVSSTYENNVLTVTGPKGSVSKMLRFPRVYIKPTSGKISIGTEKFSQSEKKIIFTYRAHVNNMIKGVTEGFTYKLVVVYAKFPMTVELKGQEFIVKNLLGQKVPKTLTIPQDVKVDIKGGKEIEVTGIDKERVGQVAASIEQSTRVTNMDRRVVQDGIFITEKPHRRYA